MRMQLACDDFDIKNLESLKTAVNKYAACNVMTGNDGRGGVTCWVTCEADIVHCMEVAAMVDLYYVRDNQQQEGGDPHTLNTH